MIKIDNLTKKYGDLVVLKDLDLHVETFAITPQIS